MVDTQQTSQAMWAATLMLAVALVALPGDRGLASRVRRSLGLLAAALAVAAIGWFRWDGTLARLSSSLIGVLLLVVMATGASKKNAVRVREERSRTLGLAIAHDLQG